MTQQTQRHMFLALREVHTASACVTQNTIYLLTGTLNYKTLQYNLPVYTTNILSTITSQHALFSYTNDT
jgi:hypothetical protein